MKIFKIAGTGKITIDVSFNTETGELKIESGHQGDAKCSDGLDESILKDLAECEIPGFDGICETGEATLTGEFFNELRAQKSPIKVQPQPGKAVSDDEEKRKKQKQNQQNKPLGLGYGV